MSIADAEPEPAPGSSGRTRRRRALLAALPMALLVAGVATYVWFQVRPSLSATYRVVDYTVPSAPRLVAGEGETVYRIDPTRSAVTYSVEERLAGHAAGTASGTTNGIAGDLALDRRDAASSRIGQIVVNVEELHSDNNLRDARIRDDFLRSHDNPLVQFTPTAIEGLSGTLADRQTYRFHVLGDMTVTGKTAPVRWDAAGSVDGDTLTVTATTTTKMSTFGVGPISLAGLVSTGDDVSLTMKLTAVDPSRRAVPTEIAAPPERPHAGGGPSFKQTIQPLLEASCASCHNEGQVGALHWKLDDAGDAAKVADGIGTVVETKYMPPWPASTQGVALAHSKQLDAKTIDAVVRWAKAGGKLDVPATTKIRPTKTAGAATPRADVVLNMPDAYTGSESNPNDYRCFVLDPKLTAPTYVTGYAVTPGHREEIHHAQIFHIDSTQAAEGLAQYGRDGQPGWSCYGGPGLAEQRPDPSSAATPTTVPRRRRLRGFTGQPGLIAGWVPGQDPMIYPDHSGVLFQPGDALVLQIHYHYDASPVPDQSTVTLQTDPATAAVKPLDIINPIAPVEIPCPPDAAGAPLCNRDAALADDARLYGPAGSTIEPGLLLLCNRTADALAASYANGVAASSCDYKVPESGTIVTAMGHMHTLGKSFRLTLQPDTPQQKVLLDIPTWNFDWQMNYELAKPLHVDAGQTVRMQCTWDRSLDPNRPPKYIVFAEGTEDEMCFSTYAIIPDNP